ncbi:MAG: zf-HC2 domain-containing protein [Lachnospiraceae bacterium]|nr:zf-HC2 domain-containing protein [Lachnospiraceae bacterium]
MKCKCGIIKDLLPLYVDHVCSDDSKELIDEHLLECENCKSYFKLLRESQDVEAVAYDEEKESRKVKMMLRMRKKLLFRNIMVAMITVFILGGACTSVIHYLKRTTVPIPETKQMEVVYENGDLVLNITDAIWSEASGVRFTLTEDGKSYECVAVTMNTSKWNELISSDQTCSKYTIAYSEKGANEIDRVYYSGDGKDLEYPRNGELNENEIQTLGYTLVWSR